MQLKISLSLIALFFATVSVADGIHIDQSKMCIFSTDEEAEDCKNGELAWAKIEEGHNPRLPLSIAAAYCDFNFELMYNDAGVICVFTDKRKISEDKADK